MNHPAPVRLRSAREYARLARRLRRQQRLTKHAAILAKERAVVVVENLDLRAMRARGGQHKRGVNRTLVEAAPRGVHRRDPAEAHGRRAPAGHGPGAVHQPPVHSLRQPEHHAHASAGALYELQHATHDRDHAAAANILLRGIAAHAAHAQNDSGPSGSAEMARQHRLPASECRRAHREPTENIHSARRSELHIVVTV